MSSVTDMSYMLFKATSFSQDKDISAWDVSQVQNMEGLFSFATSFDSVLDAWDVR